MTVMSDEEQKKIFGINLSNYVSMSGKNQKDIALDLGINPPTFNTWCTGTSIPNVSTIKKIAEYFNCNMYQLVNERTDETETYYLNEKTSAMAQKLFDNSEMRLLFDAAEDASPEDLKTTYDMLMALKRKEQGTID